MYVVKTNKNIEQSLDEQSTNEVVLSRWKVDGYLGVPCTLDDARSRLRIMLIDQHDMT